MKVGPNLQRKSVRVCRACALSKERCRGMKLTLSAEASRRPSTQSANGCTGAFFTTYWSSGRHMKLPRIGTCRRQSCYQTSTTPGSLSNVSLQLICFYMFKHLFAFFSWLLDSNFKVVIQGVSATHFLVTLVVGKLDAGSGRF